jgi:uncharacterized protein
VSNSNQEDIKLSHLIASFTILGFIYLVCIFIWKRTSALDFIRDSFHLSNIEMNLVISGGLGITMAIIAVALVKVTGTKLPKENNQSLKDLMMKSQGAIIVGILPGIFEEILFRGFLQLFIQSYSNATWAVILTTIVFWAIHLPQYKSKIILNFNVIMLSVVTGILFVQTGTLWSAILAHVVYNYLVTLAIQKKLIQV